MEKLTESERRAARDIAENYHVYCLACKVKVAFYDWRRHSVSPEHLEKELALQERDLKKDPKHWVEKYWPLTVDSTRWCPKCKVTIGGYGINKSRLPDEIEHLLPDYDLYGVDYSMGFTSRGCIRKCPWCSVWKNEGNIRAHAHVDEMLDPRHHKLLLLDNNFLASPSWHEEIETLIERKIKVSFNQGLDIRLIDPNVLEHLSRVRYYDRKFKKRRLYFSFDTPQVEKDVIRGIEMMKGIIPLEHLMFYILVGYSTNYEEDLHRIKFLTDLGILPYIMPYNRRRDSYYRHLKRWVNERFYETVPWEKYDKGDSQEIINGLRSKGN